MLSVKYGTLGEKIQNKMEEKGSVGNRLEYSVKQGVNFRKGLMKDAFVSAAGISASVGGAAIVSKSKTAQKFIGNLATKFKNTNFAKKCTSGLKDVYETAKPYLEKAAKWIIALPKPAKAVLAAGVALTGIISNINRNKIMYDAGKLYQEYTDKAKLQKLIS